MRYGAGQRAFSIGGRQQRTVHVAGPLALLGPAVFAFIGLLVFPLTLVVEESFREYIPGRVGSTAGAALTLNNYLLLIEPAYIRYFLGTFRLSLLASLLGLVIAFPLAYVIVRQRIAWIRKSLIAILISLMFLSALVRAYSILLTLGPIGFGLPLSRLMGVNVNGQFYVELTVVAGLLQYIVPMSALTLVGTLQNVNPRLTDAAISLGASYWAAHLTVTVPLSTRGMLSAFLISFTLSVSAFVIPMILGKGRALFVSNLIFSRFSEIANYPGGAAIAIVLLLISLAMVYGMIRLATAR